MAKQSLGRGLGALIQDADVSDAPEQVAINEIDIDLIEVNPWQPRTDFDEERLEELAASIRSLGIIQPLTLRKLGERRYQIIAGERRFRASKRAGLTAVPAYVREADDDTMLELALVENIQRHDLNPIEEALSYQRLIDECNLTQESMAERVGKSRSTVTNFLRLLKLPVEVQQGLRTKELTMGHARALLGLSDSSIQVMLYQQIVAEGYSVREVEERVREYNGEGTADTDNADAEQPSAKAKTPNGDSAEYTELTKKLSDKFGSKIKFSCNDKGKGKITIPFSSNDDLERILSILDQA
jgi:ParB family chromosome partitioning protein